MVSEKEQYKLKALDPETAHRKMALLICGLLISKYGSAPPGYNGETLGKQIQEWSEELGDTVDTVAVFDDCYHIVENPDLIK